MKITCDLSEHFFEVYDEAKGIAIHRSKIIKTGKVPRLTYLEEFFISVFVLLILAFILLMIPQEVTYYGALFLILVTIIYMIVTILQLIWISFIRLRQSYKGSIVINQEGLINQSYYGIKMTFAFKKIKAVVVGKHAVTILTDTPCYFYFPKSKEESIVKAFAKYNPKTPILKK